MYAFGGGPAWPSPATNVYRYDGTNWTEVAGLPAARVGAPGATFNGKIYCFGGYGSVGGMTNVYVYSRTPVSTNPSSASTPSGTLVMTNTSSAGQVAIWDGGSPSGVQSGYWGTAGGGGGGDMYLASNNVVTGGITLSNNAPSLQLISTNRSSTLTISNNATGSYITETLVDVYAPGSTADANSYQALFEMETTNAAGNSLDTSGNDYIATNSNGAVWTILGTNAWGRVEHGYTLNGSNQKFFPPASIYGASYTQGTFAAWVYAENVDAGRTLFYLGNASPLTFYRWWTWANDMWFDVYSGGAYVLRVVLTNAIPLNTWTHLGFTWSASGINCYTNGLLAGSGAYFVPSAAPTVLEIGGYAPAGDGACNWKGKLDDVFFSRSVSTSSIVFHALYCSPTGNSRARSTDVAAATNVYTTTLFQSTLGLCGVGPTRQFGAPLTVLGTLTAGTGAFTGSLTLDGNPVLTNAGSASVPAGTLVMTNTGSAGQVAIWDGGSPSGVQSGYWGAAGSGDFKADGSVPMSGVLNFGGQEATNLAAPTTASSAATKAYVDTATNNLWVATTNLNTTSTNALDIFLRAWGTNLVTGATNTLDVSLRTWTTNLVTVATNDSYVAAKLLTNGYVKADITNGLWGRTEGTLYVDTATNAAVIDATNRVAGVGYLLSETDWEIWRTNAPAGSTNAILPTGELVDISSLLGGGGSASIPSGTLVMTNTGSAGQVAIWDGGSPSGVQTGHWGTADGASVTASGGLVTITTNGTEYSVDLTTNTLVAAGMADRAYVDTATNGHIWVSRGPVSGWDYDANSFSHNSVFLNTLDVSDIVPTAAKRVGVFVVTLSTTANTAMWLNSYSNFYNSIVRTRCPVANILTDAYGMGAISNSTLYYYSNLAGVNNSTRYCYVLITGWEL